MILSDGNVAVTNEKGNILKRDNISNIEEILLLENKIEIVDNKLSKLDKDLCDKKRMEFFTKNILKVQPILMLLGTVYGAIYGLLSSSHDIMVSIIYCGVQGSVNSIVICGAATIMYGVARLVNKKKMKQIIGKIEVSKDLKVEYEKELSKTKENKSNMKAQTITINEPISLIEQTNTMESQVNEELNRDHQEYLNDKLKQKVLTR